MKLVQPGSPIKKYDMANFKPDYTNECYGDESTLSFTDSPSGEPEEGAVTFNLTRAQLRDVSTQNQPISLEVEATEWKREPGKIALLGQPILDIPGTTVQVMMDPAQVKDILESWMEIHNEE